MSFNETDMMQGFYALLEQIQSGIATRSSLPAVRQVMLTADFRFKVADGVTQAARLTEKTRQMAAESRHQESPRRHALHRLNVSRLSYLSRNIGGERRISRVCVLCMHAHRAFAGINFPLKLDREKGDVLMDTEDTGMQIVYPCTKLSACNAADDNATLIVTLIFNSFSHHA